MPHFPVHRRVFLAVAFVVLAGFPPPPTWAASSRPNVAVTVAQVHPDISQVESSSLSSSRGNIPFGESSALYLATRPDRARGKALRLGYRRVLPLPVDLLGSRYRYDTDVILAGAEVRY